MYDSFNTFIERRKIIALFKILYQRDPAQVQQLLPILLLLTPHGGGVDTLLNILMKRSETVLPHAHLDFTELTTSTMIKDLLQTISSQLGQPGNGDAGRLKFPRYHLGLSVISDALSDNDSDKLHSEIKKIVLKSSVFEKFDDVLGTTNNQPFYIAFLFIVLKWLLPMLLHLTPNISVRWYHAHNKALGMSPTSDGIDVLMRLRHWSRPNSPKEHLLIVDQLLLDAFLDDLRSSFDNTKSKARLRTTQVVLFFKHYDDTSQAGKRFLNALIRQRLDGKTDPLLIVIGSHQRLFDISDSAQNPPFQEIEFEETEQEAQVYAQSLYEGWQKQLRHTEIGSDPRMYIPAWLHDFGPKDASSLIRMMDRTQTGLFEDTSLVSKMYTYTYGHPLALTLIARVLQEAKLRDQTIDSEKFFQEMLPLDFDSAFVSADATIGNYLLHRFLSQLSEQEQEQLLFCVAPRTLTRDTLRVVLMLDSDVEATKLWNQYRKYTFARNVEPESRAITFHPLLRDLLLQRLITKSTDMKHYKVAHRKLFEYFADTPDDNEQGSREKIYHALALGNPNLAFVYVSNAIQRKNTSWEELLSVVAQAPTLLIPANTLQMANEALYRAKLHHRSDDIAIALVLYTWLSHTFTIDSRQYIDMLYNLAETYRYVSYQQVLLPSQEKSNHYLQLARSLEIKPQPQGTRPLPLTPDLTPFPVQKVNRFWYKMRVAAILLLIVALVAIYPTIYYRSYLNSYCNPASITSLPTVLQSLYFANGEYVTYAPDQECIGLSAGEFAFDTRTNTTNGNYKMQAANALLANDSSQANVFWDEAIHADTSDAEALIYKENQHVLDLSSSQKIPYVTIVVLTTLTASDANQKLIATGRDDLQGAYVAQIEHNRDFRIPLLRLLVANIGGNSEYAPEVAAQIIQASHADSSIVGVMGPPQSRTKAIQAIKMLTDAHIPVVSSTASSDTLTNLSPYFFRVAPPNEHQVAMSVQYAEQVLHAKTAVLFEALNDDYSQNLATDFVAQFQSKDHNTILKTETYDANDMQVSNVIADKAGNACSYNPDIIYFTGRSDGMIQFLDSLNPCGKNNDVKIIGGDTLFQLATAPNSGYPPYAYNRLYYTSFAFPQEWELAGLKQFNPSFFSNYPKYFDPDHRYADQSVYGYTLANGHVTLAYDATITLLSAIMDTLKNTKVLHFASKSLRDSLSRINGTHTLQGASGCIDFGSKPNGDPVNKVVVMLRVDEHGNTVMVPQGVKGCLIKK